MKNNIGRLFYKEYYKEVDFNYIFTPNGEGVLGNINDTIKASSLELIANPAKLISPLNGYVIQAKVLYPGLLTGTGLVHDSKKLKGGYNLGMHFDYTTGMPVVYGSSVKGVLSHYFKEFCQEYKDENKKSVRSGDIEDLFQSIFKGKKRDLENPTDKDGEPNYVNMSIYDRDIFFDAVIVRPYEKEGNQYLLEDDSITPHTEGPLKNPVPILMLKIAAGCILEFRFLLHKTIINNEEYDGNFKIGLFENILKTVGVGAKTNVGYGQLE